MLNPTFKLLLTFAAILIIFALILFGLGSALTPLLIAFAISYLFFPLIQKLETKGVNRALAVSVVFIVLMVIVVGAFFLVIPGMLMDAKAFIKSLPQTTEQALTNIEQLAARFGVELDLTRQGIKAWLKEHLTLISTKGLTTATGFLKGAFSNLFAVLIGILNIFLIPLFFFYVINDYEKIVAEMKSFIPNNMQSKLAHYIDLTREVLNGYIRGQIVVALILGVLYAVGLSIIGLQFGAVIGLATGIMSLIPYVGSILGFVAAITMGLANFTDWHVIVGVGVVFAIVQTLEGFFITPKLVGNKVGLSAFATVLALIIGGNLLGFAGMFLAIPLAAIVKVLLLDLRSQMA